MGLVFEPLGVRFHRFDQFSDPLLRLGFAPFQGLHDKTQRLRGLRPPAGDRQPGHLVLELRPVLGELALHHQLLAGLPDRPAGQGGTPPQRLHPLALDLGGGGDPDEFVVTQCQRREVETVGLDDLPGRRIPPAVALALLVVANHEDPGLE